MSYKFQAVMPSIAGWMQQICMLAQGGLAGTAVRRSCKSSSDQLPITLLPDRRCTKYFSIMGADCCGGESLPAAQHKLNDLHLNTLSNNGAKAADPKSHEESAKELEGFIRKRIALFDQYNARHIAEVRSLPI